MSILEDRAAMRLVENDSFVLYQFRQYLHKLPMDHALTRKEIENALVLIEIASSVDGREVER